MSEQATTKETVLGSGVSATGNEDGIELLVFGTPRVSLSPMAFVELMRFARKHLGEDVFREIDRMAGGDTTIGAKPLLSGDPIPCTESPGTAPKAHQ